uniref:Uncharacterized protein n=1 Tax=Nelumbo nucifera TaxID=4432 RepID=A0A822Z7Z8_NELNU|nr:TPA_asm: hypothetical protein HUJ06_000754 [Nelumbo nucifera]
MVSIIGNFEDMYDFFFFDKTT